MNRIKNKCEQNKTRHRHKHKAVIGHDGALCVPGIAKKCTCVRACVRACMCVVVYHNEKKVPDEWQARQAIPVIFQVSSSKHNAKKCVCVCCRIR